ncbi:hypothetical protein CBER1_03315 [Cercospora berteroae]|uniref:Uncharacterized protein n=1 Tax=Cercospora berteroae TaxID=357750 RepID=A0A2S6BQQ3_9PEZI|nr:hypothetical protein CBER1_03315 [Cercospora berteroae]
MRLFDNSAIRIDLFPGRKDKKDGKNKNTTKTNEPRTASSRGTKFEKDAPSSTVKAAKSMQNMDRKTPQRPDASRAYNSYDVERPGNGYSKGGTSYTYQRPSMDRADHDANTRDFEPKKSSSWQRNDPSSSRRNEANSNSPVDQRPNATTHQNYNAQRQMNSEPESSSRDQRRSRADIQDEFEAQQSLRTNIPLGAPHSTGHALKQKRSKADMIRATENMARTLSRSPHRSPANRRQRNIADDSRPGTSSSNGSFQHTQFSHSNSSRANNGIGRSASRETGSAHSHSRQRSADTNEQNAYRPQTADSSRSNNSTDRAPQYDGLSPTKVSGVAKKQGSAFKSTIRTSPPLPMEPNKTTWSPTSSVARNKSSERQNKQGQKDASTAGAGTQATHSDQPIANNANAVRSNTQAQESSYNVSKNSNNRRFSMAPNDNDNNSNATTHPYMNFSRPSNSDLKSESANKTNTGPANLDTTAASTGAGQGRAEPTPPATKAVDFAAIGQSSKQQQSNNNNNTMNNASGSKSKKNNYVDAGNSTTSPWQRKFGTGGKDPRKVPNHIVGQQAINTSSSHNRNKSSNPNRFSNTNSIVNNLKNSSHPAAAATRKNKPIPQPLSLGGKPETSGGNKRAKVVTIDNNGGGNTVVPTPSSSRFSADPQSAGRHDAKVVAINNGGGGGKGERSEPIEDCSVSEQGAWDAVDQKRKDSGQSDSMDFGGKSTYTYSRNDGKVQSGFEGDVGERVSGGSWNAAQTVGGS